MNQQHSVLDRVLGGLMARYTERVPDVRKIIDTMLAEKAIKTEEDIDNDHIAFRTMGVPHLGLQSLEKVFLHYGYERRDNYEFDVKKLNAYWYSPPSARYPRVFLSELKVGELSEPTQRIIKSYTDTVAEDPVDQLDLDDPVAVDAFLHQPLWRTPTIADYNELATESEYAAWVIYNRYYLNHFTISVHNLPDDFNTVDKFNEFLQRHNVRLNDSGGIAKRSPDGLLIQSSTVAELVNADFDDGAGGVTQKMIPGSYVEFAERLPLPQFSNLANADIRRAHRRDGFATANADRIFESTFSHQTGKTANPGD